MALSNLQRVQIRYYLGWSARFLQFDSRLEQAMNALDSLTSSGDADTIAEVQAVLTSLADVEQKILDAHTNLQAMELGSIKLDGVRQIGMLRSEGRRFVGRLASTLGIGVRQDVFSSSLPSEFASAGGMTGGRGNLPRLG